MGFCRIITIVHRPSDVIGGLVLGILIPLLLASPFLFPYFQKWLITPLVKFQEWIFGWVVKDKF
jgi:membrane-associated phospholipid phosphatase